jgi:hypothetical protein
MKSLAFLALGSVTLIGCGSGNDDGASAPKGEASKVEASKVEAKKAGGEKTWSQKLDDAGLLKQADHVMQHECERACI